jgi:single-stranded-DNA-specific exonuclease
MFEELVKCKDILHKFGGHPMAAGLSLKEENIQVLRKRLLDNCGLTEEELIPKIRIDKKIPLNEISYKLVEDIKILEPFGKGNPSPLFAEKSVEIYKVAFIGREKNVLKMMCRIRGTFNKIDGISFDHAEEFKSNLINMYGEERLEALINGNDGTIQADIIFYPDINEYNGMTSLQLYIKEIRLCN